MRQKQKKPKPPHPGEILEEFYIKQLELKLDELADNLKISRNTLYKIRKGIIRVTPDIAFRLSLAFSTTVEFWLNLQQKYDVWEVENKKPAKRIAVMYRPKPPRTKISHLSL